MPLLNGTKLSHYEVLAPVAAGGMGEVYKARDPRLNRTVAIKVLPSHIAQRADLKQRFEREAQTIASLNHPHICVVHDVGQHEGIDFIVMEYLEGQTLADRIAKGPVAFDRLLAYAIQIADALDKAHSHGVTHRDLKPGNIMLTGAGVKLLDFGLAKVNEPVLSSQSVVPTIMSAAQPLTMEGTILGTLQYMAPEQLEGKEADARTDIFAFGAILYEMATGRRAFEGKSQVSLIAAILEHDPPPVSATYSVAPPLFDHLIKVCLEKSPQNRWQSATDLLHQLKFLERQDGVPNRVAKAPRHREKTAWLVVFLLAVALVVTLTLPVMRDSPAPQMASFELRAVGSNLQFAISPDGRNLVARLNESSAGPTAAGRSKLWVRSLGRLNWTALQGTDGAGFPFWSPDGRFIGFFAEGKLKRIDILGAPPQTLTDAALPRGGTWNSSGVILFAPRNDGGLYRMASSGGASSPVTELDKSRGETAHVAPRFLPDGDHFLYVAVAARPEDSQLRIGSLSSKDTKSLLPASVAGAFAPPDQILFLRGGTLMAQQFDINRLELIGEPILVSDQISSNMVNGAAGFGVSENGILVYRPGGDNSNRELVWVDRSGKVEGSIEPRGNYENPRLSPDGKRVAVLKRENNSNDIWIIDLERGNSARFTFDDAVDNAPLWAPDGKRIAFVSDRDGGVFNIYTKDSSGAGADELILKTPNNKLLDDWSADGRYIIYQENDPKTKNDLWLLPLFGDRTPTPLLVTGFNEHTASFSPDGRWLAYASDDSGRSQVYVQSFPPSGGKWQVSASLGQGQGFIPRWRPDGKELFYDGAGPMMAVDLTGTIPGREFKAGIPRRLFGGLQNIGIHNYDIAANGQRFLVLGSSESVSGADHFVVVMNWRSGLKR